jgi:hypothetical protein
MQPGRCLHGVEEGWERLKESGGITTQQSRDKHDE